MFRKLIIIFSLISFCPVAAGAQDLALMAKSQPAVAGASDQGAGADLNLMPVLEKKAPVMVSANDVQDVQGTPAAEAPRSHKTHTGLTFKEFAEVHWGEYRWVYWVGAATALVLLHVFAFRD